MQNNTDNKTESKKHKTDNDVPSLLKKIKELEGLKNHQEPLSQEDRIVQEKSKNAIDSMLYSTNSKVSQ